MPSLVSLIKEQRRSCPDTNSWRKYNFDTEAKGQGHTGYKCMWHIIPRWNTHVSNIVCLFQRTKRLREKKHKAMSKIIYRISGFFRVHPFSTMFARVSKSWKIQSGKFDTILQIKYILSSHLDFMNNLLV